MIFSTKIVGRVRISSSDTSEINQNTSYDSDELIIRKFVFQSRPISRPFHGVFLNPTFFCFVFGRVPKSSIGPRCRTVWSHGRHSVGVHVADMQVRTILLDNKKSDRLAGCSMPEIVWWCGQQWRGSGKFNSWAIWWKGMVSVLPPEKPRFHMWGDFQLMTLPPHMSFHTRDSLPCTGLLGFPCHICNPLGSVLEIGMIDAQAMVFSRQLWGWKRKTEDILWIKLMFNSLRNA